MKIDLVDNQIVLDPESDLLKFRHKAQLGAWGFDKSDGMLVAKIQSDQLLLKIVKYLKKHGYKLSLTKGCLSYIKSVEQKKSELDKKLTLLRDFKDGNYNKKDLGLHNKFLLGLSRTLKDHQVKASLHLYLALSGANFSVPGSGKTTVVLSVYERLRKEGKVDALFVIGPPSCFGPWKEEFREVLGRDSQATMFAGGHIATRKENYYKSDHSELNLTSFHTIRRDYKDLAHFLKSVRTMLVVDEGHYIKQIGGEWASSVLYVSEFASYRVVLTGTPMPRSYLDLFNIFEYLYPGCDLLTSEDKLTIGSYEKERKNSKARDLLEERIGPLFYRVRKAELGLADQVFCEPTLVEMNPYEKQIYEAIVTRIVQYSRDDYFHNIEYVNELIRGRMIRLRQCISYAGLLGNTVEGYDEDLLGDKIDLRKIIFNYDNLEKPAKLLKLMDMVKICLAENKKVLIWSNFIGTINLIETELKENNIYSKKIIGAIPVESDNIGDTETREKIRNEFVDSDSDLMVLLANPAACAESISLHKSCQNAIYYDLSYNCAQYLQSLDRIHRVGGSENRKSFYHFLQYSESLDEDILENLENKSEKMRKLVDQDYEIYSLDMGDNADELDAYRKIVSDV